jgi:hypothetical protein
MSPTEITQDGATLWSTLASPSRGLSEVVARRRSLTALIAATAAALLFAWLAAPRLDFEAGASNALDAGPKAAEMTPYERDQALAQAQKVGEVSVRLGGAFAPAAFTLGVALALWLAFRVAGTRPDLRGTLAVATHALWPLWLARLLTLPAVLWHAPVRAEELGRLLPSSAAALLPSGVAPPLMAVAGAVDLFALWTVLLLVGGMARLSGASRTRAAAVVTVLWLAQVVFFHLVPAALAGGRPA